MKMLLSLIFMVSPLLCMEEDILLCNDAELEQIENNIVYNNEAVKCQFCDKDADFVYKSKDVLFSFCNECLMQLLVDNGYHDEAK